MARPAVSLVVWVRGGVGAHHVLGQVGEKSGQLSVAAILTENKKHKRFYLTISERNFGIKLHIQNVETWETSTRNLQKTI